MNRRHQLRNAASGSTKLLHIKWFRLNASHILYHFSFTFNKTLKTKSNIKHQNLCATLKHNGKSAFSQAAQWALQTIRKNYHKTNHVLGNKTTGLTWHCCIHVVGHLYKVSNAPDMTTPCHVHQSFTYSRGTGVIGLVTITGKLKAKGYKKKKKLPKVAEGRHTLSGELDR